MLPPFLNIHSGILEVHSLLVTLSEDIPNWSLEDSAILIQKVARKFFGVAETKVWRKLIWSDSIHPAKTLVL